jgi:uncharacterized membrane protein YraQ (UPF0718 family)
MLEEVNILADIGPQAATFGVAYVLAKASVHLIWATLIGYIVRKFFVTASGEKALKESADTLTQENRVLKESQKKLKKDLELWKTACDNLDKEIKDGNNGQK